MRPAEAEAATEPAGGAEQVDALTAQLRRMYEAIADEPIPPTLLALLYRLKN